jgi:hypothetical protein
MKIVFLKPIAWLCILVVRIFVRKSSLSYYLSDQEYVRLPMEHLSERDLDILYEYFWLEHQERVMEIAWYSIGIGMAIVGIGGALHICYKSYLNAYSGTHFSYLTAWVSYWCL